MTTTQGLSRRWKQVGQIIGFLWGLPGIPLVMACICIGFSSLFEFNRYDDPAAIAFLSITLIFASGFVVMWHFTQSLWNNPAPLINFWSGWVFPGVFGLLILLGLILQDMVVLFPPVLWLLAACPPLGAVAWFAGRQSQGITWRRGVVSFIGGGTLGVGVTLVLGFIVSFSLIAFLDLTQAVFNLLDNTLGLLTNHKVAELLFDPEFIFLFFQIAIIAPFIEELAKPLIMLPLARYLSQRQAFLIGAIAGAGFATLENVIYVGLSLRFWVGIILLRALGAAIHPVGSGLMGIAWRDWLCGEPGAFYNWLKRFRMATGIHALWNGGSLIVLVLGQAVFSGRVSIDIGVLGFSVGGITLATLFILGLVALWLGRHTANELQLEPEKNLFSITAGFVLSDRTMAIWGFACLAIIVPAGIVILGF